MDRAMGTDYTHNEANWTRQRDELLAYYASLVRRPDALAHAAFKDNMGFDLVDLDAKHRRVSSKIRHGGGA